MTKSLLFPALALTVIMGATAARADVIILNDGSKIRGTIEEQTRYFTRVRKGDELITVYPDQIAEIRRDEVDVNVAYELFPLIPGEKVDLIYSLLEVNGTRDRMDKSIQRVMDQTEGRIDPRVVEVLDTEAMINSLVPIYDKHFTADELTQMVRFYRSPVGQKLVDATPSIMEETAKATVFSVMKARQE